MARCPNCGEKTRRTSDWACQWCGYPLMSGNYKMESRTYEELREERLRFAQPPSFQETFAANGARYKAGFDAETEFDLQRSDVAGETTEEEDSESEAVTEKDAATAEDTDIEETTASDETDDDSSGYDGAGEEESISGIIVEVPEHLQTPEIAAASSAKEEATEEKPGIPGTVDPDDIVEVSVVALHAAFKTDHEAAEDLFKNKILRVTGAVGRIIINDIVDNPCLILTGSDKTASMRNVICLFDKSNEDELKKLSVDQVVVVEGIYDSYTINILLTHCHLIR